MLRVVQRGGQTADRAEAGFGVENDRHIRSDVRAIGTTGDEKLLWLQGAQRGQLSPPQRLPVDDQASFIEAHARGFSAREQNGGEGQR